MADDVTTAPADALVDEAALRRDAEDALAVLYPRVLDVERQLLEEQERGRAQERTIADLRAELARVEGVEGRLVEARADADRLRAQLTEERLRREAAERHVEAIEQTKVFRATAGARQVYGRLRSR